MFRTKYAEGITFDDVLIQPRKSEITSRSNVDISSEICGYTLGLPVISANMDTITETEMSVAMNKNGGIGVLHRFEGWKMRTSMAVVANSHPDSDAFGFSVGLDDDIDWLKDLWVSQPRLMFFVVDVAHGGMTQVAEYIERLKEKIVGVKVVAGNVATAECARMLGNAGADCIKVGVGPGSACSTRVKTGIGVPQLTAIDRVSKVVEGTRVKMIADGGIRKPADVAKALAAGADAVMIGGMLAGTDETPDPSSFRGMSSREAAEANGKSHYASEGVSVDVEPAGPVADVLEEIEGGLRSAFSYVGARNLHEFRDRSTFVEISRASQTENRPHIQHRQAKMQVPSHDTEDRSDEDIREVLRVAVTKYNRMGAMPILPLTEGEFERLLEIVDKGLNDD